VEEGKGEEGRESWLREGLYLRGYDEGEEEEEKEEEGDGGEDQDEQPPATGEPAPACAWVTQHIDTCVCVDVQPAVHALLTCPPGGPPAGRASVGVEVLETIIGCTPRGGAEAQTEPEAYQVVEEPSDDEA
jgi:hypothetical protein